MRQRSAWTTRSAIEGINPIVCNLLIRLSFQHDCYFYPTADDAPDKNHMEIGDHVVSALSTLAFVVPGPYGVVASAGISLGYIIMQNMGFGNTITATARSAKAAKQRAYSGGDLTMINNDIKEIINWMSDHDDLFKSLKKEQVFLIRNNHLEWLEDQSKPDSRLTKAINDLFDLWRSWFDDSIEQSLSNAFICYFLTFNRRCYIYANLARLARLKGQDSWEEYNENIACLKDCLKRMENEFERRSKDVSDKIQTMKAERLVSLSEPYRTGETSSFGLTSTTDEDLAFGTSSSRNWEFKDYTAGRTHELATEDYLPTERFIVWATKYQWQNREAEARSEYKVKVDMFKGHVERHFGVLTKIMDACQGYIRQAENVMNPVGPLAAPMDIEFAPLSSPSSKLEITKRYAYRYEISHGSAEAISSPWSRWISLPNNLSSPRLMLEDGKTPASTRRTIFRKSCNEGISGEISPEEVGEEVDSVETFGYCVWADAGADPGM